MSYDLEYFTEFLEHPSAPDIGEFYEMVTNWGEYVREHRDEFNYLEDDEWKEIRERIIDEVGKRDFHRKAMMPNGKRRAAFSKMPVRQAILKCLKL